MSPGPYGPLRAKPPAPEPAPDPVVAWRKARGRTVVPEPFVIEAGDALADRLAELEHEWSEVAPVLALLGAAQESLHLLRRGRSWEAMIDGLQAWGDTPFAALTALAGDVDLGREALERR